MKQRRGQSFRGRDRRGGWPGAVCFGGNFPLALVNDNGPVERRLSLSLPTSYMGMLVSSYGGADDVIAMSSSSVEAMYADPERADGTGAYLFLYEGGGAVVVSVLAHNGVVSMNAELMPLEDLAGCQSASEASLWLMHRTIPAVCTEVNVE